MSSEKNFNPYQPEYVSLFEALYGQHLMSLGGINAIENMFSDIHLACLTALDVGFGIGGVAFYLAKKYKMQVFGVEMYSWMAQYAEEHAPKELADQLHFKRYGEEEKIPFSAKKFDLVYSKGVLNHVSNKIPLFQQIHSCLKDKGHLVIADWIYPKAYHCMKGPLVKETEDSYRFVLNASGFDSIEFRDDSEQFEIYVLSFLDNLDLQRVFISEHFGEKVFLSIRSDHLKLLENIRHKDKIAVRILIKK
ncbi:methyltransferase domain-containing protein [Legionella israelensis]|uniref:Methyltransferase domain-containing protein n=1 Tax=Legionella israelensis TaxID=454 RepID=A0AAX1EED9_9GAMM|nr:methyltransferase domain-containing protein [Legionella israelensis]QBR83481.1 methyltransferase domain-containing protein [Legionella israelensis]